MDDDDVVAKKRIKSDGKTKEDGATQGKSPKGEHRLLATDTMRGYILL